jgi:MoaA/NifB/PqqE/SkfB family radical SAM enzyme
VLNYNEIKNVHLEISTRCNAACPECPRNLHGIDDIVDDYPVCDMTLNQFVTIFRPEFLGQIEFFLINGNYGDFITCRDGIEILEYLRQCNPNLSIEIQTNGSGQPKIWKRLAELNVRVNFSIDGTKETNHLYRQNTNFDLIISNAKTFIEAGGHAEWHLTKFTFNENQIDEIAQLAKDYKFQKVLLRDAGRNNYHLFNKDKTYKLTIGNPKFSKNFQDHIDVYNWSKSSNKIEFYNRTESRNITCHAKGAQAIYVAANGEVYPCCFTGFFPKTNHRKLGNDQLRKILKDFNNNALEVGLEKSLEWFNELKKTWTIPRVADGRNYICNETCGSI